MNRLLFEKTGDAVYLSHLDLMRVFQRAFKRADIMIWHSQGFSPRAYVSIALPLPVGSESVCEILDFEIQDGSVDLTKLPTLLNRTMPAGIRVLEAYESAVKIKHLTRLRAQITLEYDRGIPGLFCCRTERTVRRNGAVLSGFHRLKGDHRITVIKQHIFCPQLLPQSLQNRYGIGRNAGVPVPIVLVSQRPDHSDPGIRLQLQRQDPAVMEQAHLFHGSTAVHCTVQQRVRFRRLGVIGTAVPVKFSQPEPSGERIPHSTVNIGFCQQPSVQCISGCCRHHVCFIGHHIIAVFQAGGKSLCTRSTYAFLL